MAKIFHVPNKPKLTSENLETLTNAAYFVRKEAITAIGNVGSGHPGGSLSVADILVTLWASGNFDPERTDYREGDVVVLSKGHAAPALYSTLCMFGYFSFDDFKKNLRKKLKIWQGHPVSMKELVGIIPFSTGSLGQGLGNACGLAVAKKLKAKQESYEDNSWVYTVLSDGELREGSTFEAINCANKHKIGNLIAIVDDNKLQIDGPPQELMPLNVKGLFENANWKVYEINGHDIQELYKTLYEAKKDQTMPKVIIANTIKGKGVSFMEGRREWHGKAPKGKDLEEAITELEEKITNYSFLDSFRGDKTVEEIKKIREYKLRNYKEPALNLGQHKVYQGQHKLAKIYGKTLQELMHQNQQIVVLVPDLAQSLGLASYDLEIPGIAEDQKLKDRYFNEGLTEQNVVSFAGGLAAGGFLPYVSTFAKFFLERARDQLDMNTKGNLNVKYVMRNIGLDSGQDGESHQELDYLNLAPTSRCACVIPGDANQLDAIVRWSLTSMPRSVCIFFARESSTVIEKDNKPFYDKDYVFDPSKAEMIREGDDATIITYGPMVQKALNVAKKREKKYGEKIRIINFPCQSLGLRDKYIDYGIVEKAAKETKAILFLEDHHYKGSLGRDLTASLKSVYIARDHMAIPNDFKGTSDTTEELYIFQGLDEGEIEKRIGKLVAKK